MSAEVLKIEKQPNACGKRLRLSGRFGSQLIPFVRSVMSNGCALYALNLGEVTLVDLEVIRFLISCEDEGVTLVECPPYVREWILRERAEGRASPPSAI